VNLNSPWPFVVINLVCLALGSMIVLGSPFYRQHVYDQRHGRTEMIDGLRGWLALGVFFHHVMATFFFRTQGIWDAAPAHFYELTGQVGVSLFFMITGFLFWGRVVRGDGKLDAKALYLSRLRRIVPMYLVSVLMLLAVVAVLSGFTLRVGMGDFVRELRAWLSFGFLYGGDLNGVKGAHSIEAVYWTLAYEWAFYLALPFLALFVRPLPFLGLLAAVCFFGTRSPEILNFAFGAIAAVIVKKRVFGNVLPDGRLTPIPLACLAAVFAFPSAYGFAPGALLFVFFLFVVHGNSLFGLLSSGGSKLLGTVSYSLYLVHCIALFVVMHTVNAYVPLAVINPVPYWMLAGLAAVITVLVSAVTYRYVEYPFIARSARAGAGAPEIRRHAI
jgi:peptidoglycan/LPS O-acetylase OafA/YrhL